MHDRLRVVQYGLGPIGIQMVKFLSERPAVEIVGAVDISPEKIGKDLGELAGLAAPLGVLVSGDGAGVLKKTKADAVVLTTTSILERIAPDVIQIVSSGVNVVSSCEELMFPWLTRPDIARQIDDAASRHGVSVLSTGVNPGFLMDFLPLVLTGVCRNVKKIRVERIQDAQFRRLPFQKKIGAALSLDEFQAKADQGVLRHVGLTESLHMIATKLGWKLDRTEDQISPIIAEKQLRTEFLTIESGQAAGVSQMGRGFRNGEEVISLIFRAAVGEPDSHERIQITGTPDIDMTIANGVNGDVATCAIIANAVPVVINAKPGLRTMADIEIIPCMS
ncbi:MAG: dihydrodipicolinate reductase [Syntrophobacteraceae bacterium]